MLSKICWVAASISLKMTTPFACKEVSITTIGTRSISKEEMTLKGVLMSSFNSLVLTVEPVMSDRLGFTIVPIAGSTGVELTLPHLVRLVHAYTIGVSRSYLSTSDRIELVPKFTTKVDSSIVTSASKLFLAYKSLTPLSDTSINIFRP